jgi:phage terminase large subunit-like protein
MAPETLMDKRRAQGQYTFGTQMLLNPMGDSSQGFKREWLCWSASRPTREGVNVYIIVDPANTKKKKSDWTCMWAIGAGRDRNYVVLDLVRDKLNLKERADTLFELHEKWLPLGVGYEEYGMQADIQFIEHLQNERNYRFKITPLGGSMSKPDRIKRLVPVFEEGRMYLPRQKHRTLYDGSTVNLIDSFVEEEYAAFPVAVHDDMLDCLARILDEDMKIKWPIGLGALTGWERPEAATSSRDWRDRRRG